MSLTAPTLDRLAPLARVLPSRVRRNYRGGKLLDLFEGSSDPHDSDRPEDWIASTTLAQNPGLSPIADEGFTRLQRPDGVETTLPALIASAPGFYLGSAQNTRDRGQLGFLAKLLDSSMRLHVQAHPTAAFAREFLGSPFGKLEVYYVLAVRDPATAHLRLGFQRPISRTEWGQIVESQDIEKMDTCFAPIPVQPGEFWIVPGGLPHAIGPGVLMVEVMEPSDWVVRCEFEREGIIVPPAARFMNRGLEFCLDIFDYQARSVADIHQLCQLTPCLRTADKHGRLECIVGTDQTRCFEIHRLITTGRFMLGGNARPKLVIQTRGRGILIAAGYEVSLRPAQSCFIAAALQELEFVANDPDCEWLICSPI